MNPFTWRWDWIVWQVLLPIFGPIIISFLVALFWTTGPTNFNMRPDVILDVTPWALLFYSITLVCVTMNDLWPRIGRHQMLGWGLITTAIAASVYASFIVIWRHDPHFKSTGPIYLVTLILVAASIILCHQSAETPK
jgi:hypothetical protein